MSPSQTKIRVAILGGGVSGLATAYELAHPRHAGRYEVTIYQMGWRLGGKCASGRNPDAGMRVEEHGPHAFFGFYDNTFQTLRECYDALGRKLLPGDPLPGNPALAPRNEIYSIERLGANGQPAGEGAPPAPGDVWMPWRINTPVMPGEPGAPLFTQPRDIVVRVLDLTRDGIDQIFDRLQPLAANVAVASELDVIATTVTRAGPLPTSPAMMATTHLVAHVLSTWHSDLRPQLQASRAAARLTAQSLPSHAVAPQQIDALLDQLAGLLGPWQFVREMVDRLAADGLLPVELRRLFVTLDLGITALAGALQDGLIFDVTEAALDAANRHEFRAWLALHNGSATMIGSAPVRSLYDTAFAYAHGHNSGPNAEPACEAGSSVRVLGQLMLYNGSYFYKMQAGTGDVIVGALYEHMRKTLGVKFRFFHRIDGIEPTADGKDIAAVRFTRQVALTVPDDDFEPLRPVGSLMCWLDRPPFDKIEHGDDLRLLGIDLEDPTATWNHEGGPGTLRVGPGGDFDHVVLAISVAALPTICGKLIALRPPWQTMLGKVQTIVTQSAQFWFDAPGGLGWRGDPNSAADAAAHAGAPLTVLCGFNYGGSHGAFDTWFDASDVEPTELWPPGGPKPTAMAILCGTLPDELATTKAAADAATAASVTEFLAAAPAIWPALYVNGQLQTAKLFDAPGLHAPTPLDAQYSNTATSPSDRYVLTVPDSSRFRLPPEGSLFPSLVLAGDWTRYGMNLGCFEGAVISGRIAANTIAPESPRPIIRDLRPIPSGAAPPVPAGGAYVTTAADLTLPGAIDMPGSTFWSFLLPADIDRLRALSARCFAAPSSGAISFEPLGPFCIMSLLKAPRSTLAVDPAHGSGAEQELNFAIPGIWTLREAGKPVQRGFAVFLPYLFLDSPAGVAIGREVFGFAKQMARLHIPPAGPAGARVAVFGADRLAKDVVWDWQAFLTLSGPTAPSPAAVLRSGWQLSQQLSGLLTRSATTTARSLLDATTQPPAVLLARKLPVLCLKQFRDATVPGAAAYQAIVLAEFRLQALHSAGFLPPHRMTLRSLQSTPVAADLGICDTTITGPGMKVVLDMRLDPGQVLWRAG